MKWYLFLIVGVCCISTSAILVTLSGAPPTSAAVYRNLFAALIWLGLYRYSTPFKHCRLRPSVEQAVTAGWLRRVVQRGGIIFIFVGIGLTFAIDLWAWHRCIMLVGAGPATLFGNLQVVFIALFSRYVFGEQLKPYYWQGACIALVGIGLLTLTRGGGTEVGWGVVFGLLTALTYAIFLIFLKLLGQYECTAEQTLFWVAVTTLVFLMVPFYLETEEMVPDMIGLSWLFLHGLISSVLGWWLIVKALSHLPVAQTATLLLVQPLLTSLWGHLFLGQYLQLVQLVGIGVALLGIRLANWQR